MLLKGLGFLAVVAVAIGAGLFVLGKRQPSSVLAQYETIIFVSLKQAEQRQGASSDFGAGEALWRGRTAMTLIGPEDAYWTDYLLLPPDTALIETLKAGADFEDVYAAEVRLTKVPPLALGVLRAGHLLGLARRPAGALPEEGETMEGREDILPRSETMMALKTASADRSFTMVNYLKYFPVSADLPEGGRPAYREYGLQAMKTVHRVGGQLLFAGRVKSVLIDSPEAPTAGAWDDLAAMIYPDPTAILSMEQVPAYQAALGLRDKGLERTVVIATEAY